MKYALLSLFIFGSLNISKAAAVDGYYITKNNDTLYTKIYLPTSLGHNLIELQYKVEVLDVHSSKIIEWRPNEILGFAFDYKGHKYVYISKHFDNELGFYERKIHDSNFSLYQIAYTGGFMSANQSYYMKYIIARNDSLYVVIPHENANKTRERLKVFFADPTTQKYIEDKFRYRITMERDVYEFVKYVNLSK